MMNPKTTHAQDMSQRINIDVALFMQGKSAASIDDVLPIAAAPAIHTDFKNTENKDMRAVMRSMRFEEYKDHSDYHLMTQDFLYSIAEHFNGFDRLPVHWEDDKDVYTDEIADYLKRH